MNKTEIEQLRVFLDEKLKKFTNREIDHEEALDTLSAELEDEYGSDYSFNYNDVEEGDWVSEGKYLTLKDCVVKLMINGVDFYSNVSSLKTGSYHSDFYFHGLRFSELMTEKEFNAPTIKYTTQFEEYQIDFMSDGKVWLNKGEKMFINFEFAMKYIFSNR